MRNIERVKDGEWIQISIKDCYEESFFPVTDEWKKKLKFKSIKDLILLKKGESKKIMIPFHLYQEMAKWCNYEYTNYDSFKNNEYVFYLTYDLREDHSEEFLSKDVRDSLNEQSYKIYNGFLKSNKVPLIID